MRGGGIMFYIFNKDGVCIASTTYPVNTSDLKTRNEIVVESTEIYEINKIEYKNNKISLIIVPPTPLSELKVQKIESFKILRDKEEVAPVEYNGKLFDYDDKARERLLRAEKALIDNNIPSQEWVCYDNTKMNLVVQDFKNINTVVAVRSATLHKKYNELKDKINACKTEEELNEVIW